MRGGHDPAASLSKAKNPWVQSRRKAKVSRHRSADPPVNRAPQDQQADLEQKLLGILNKLTPQTYEKLKAQILGLNVTRCVCECDHDIEFTAVRFSVPLLRHVGALIFEKVVMEPQFSELYATLCRDVEQQIQSWNLVCIMANTEEPEFYMLGDLNTNDKSVVSRIVDHDTRRPVTL